MALRVPSNRTRRPARLRDGSAVCVRPICDSDKSALGAAFERLSPESRYQRFLSETPRLTQRHLAYLTEIDHRRHEALIAFDDVTGQAVGTARFVRDSEDATTAELAVAVVDDWHGRGLGATLLERLIGRARAEGVRRVTATVLAGNTRMLGLLRTLPELDEVHVERATQGTVEVSARLTAAAGNRSRLSERRRARR